MGKDNEYVSRPVRIRLKKSKEIIEGNIIFDTGANQDPVLSRLLTMIKFRFSDAQKAEAVFSLLDVDMINYL